MLRRSGFALVLCLVSGLLSGCSLFPSYFGTSNKIPLPGKRVPILASETTLKPDPTLASAPVLLPVPYVNPTWPETGGYPSHAMYHLALGPTPHEIWRTSVGEAGYENTGLFAEPVVGGGRVYTMDAYPDVDAIDAKSGRHLWRIDLKPSRMQSGVVGGGLAYSYGTIYATTAYGQVFAISAKTGKVLWHYTAGIPFRSGPTVDGARVYAITNDNQLYAFSAKDGKVLWSYIGVPEPAVMVGGASPAVADGVVVAAFSSGDLVALRADDGSVLWTTPLVRPQRSSAVGTITDIDGEPVIDRGRIFAISHAGIMASVDLQTGERIWVKDVSGVQTPWAAGEFVYVVTTKGEVLCVSAADGRIKWNTQLSQYLDAKDKTGLIVWRGPLLAGNRLILVSNYGYAVVLSPYTGELLGEMKLSGSASLPPVVANKTLYILTNNATLIALQ